MILDLLEICNVKLSLTVFPLLQETFKRAQMQFKASRGLIPREPMSIFGPFCESLDVICLPFWFTHLFSLDAVFEVFPDKNG